MDVNYLMKKYILLINLIIYNLMLGSCKIKNKNHYEYWEAFFHSHDEMRTKSFMGSEYEILFGNMHPDREAILRKDSGSNYFLSGSVKRNKEKYTVSFESDTIPDKNDVLHIYTNYQFKENLGKETYLIRRISHFSGPEFTILDFIAWFSTISESIPVDKIRNSNTYQTFCSQFNCKLDSDSNKLSFYFTPNSNFQKENSTQYARLKKFLDLAVMDLRIFSPDNIQIFSLSNSRKDFYLSIFQNKISKLTGSYQILFTLNVDYYGLKINLIDVGYKIEIDRNQNEVFLSGSYNKYPQIKVSGRLWHILPPEILNVFIPGDMESYFKNYFDMITKSNFIKISTKSNNGQMNMVIINQSEVFRKPFRLFGNPTKNEKSNSNFNQMIESAILEDLR